MRERGIADASARSQRDGTNSRVGVPRAFHERAIRRVSPILGDQNASDERGVGRGERPVLRTHGSCDREERDDEGRAALREESHDE